MDLSAAGLQSNFTSIDWAIVAAYLLGSVAIGLCVNRYIANMADYIVAGRALRSCLAIATMVGSELGLVTVMYSAQKGFTGGFAAFHIALAAGVVTLVVGLTGFIVVPLRRMGVMTIPEFYGRRFGRDVRIFGGAILALAGILNMGLFLKAGTIFVTALTGMNSEFELKMVMTVLLGLVLFYTILGGMVSVVITDYIQFVVLSFGMLIACAFAANELGWTTIIETVKNLKGEAGFNPFDTNGFGTGYVVWMIFTAGLVSCAVWQTAVMRACSAESTAVVKRLYAWSSIGFMIRFLLPYFLGISALVYVSQRPELREFFLAQSTAPDADASVTLAAMPAFLSQILPPGLIGLIAAGMLAAFMSTHDSYLLCWSSVLTQDVVAPSLGERLTTRGRLTLTRAFIAIIGVFLLLWSLWYPLGQDMWDYMAITGAVYFTGGFALLLCGIYWRRASRVGALLALSCGFVALLGLKPLREAFGLESFATNNGVELTGETIGLTTVALCLVAMVVGSLLFPDRTTPTGAKE